MQGIVCDVGHTIITDSILNQILLKEGKSDSAVKLYDEQFLTNKNQDDIDSWVVKVSSSKINSLHGISVEHLEAYCKSAKFTAGLLDFVSKVIARELPIIFIGAVPELITKSLLKHAGVSVTMNSNVYVAGSKIKLIDGKVDKPVSICTPSVKKKLIEQWASSLKLDTTQLMVIGDSIGDIPAMELTEKIYRYGIHVNSSKLKNIINVEVNDFFELSNVMENFTNKMEIEL